MNHKFKHPRKGYSSHLAVRPCVLVLEGHHVPQPILHVSIPEPKPMPVYGHAQRAEGSYVQMSEEDRLWTYSTRVFGRDNDPRRAQ